jgi:transcriptional regulator with XRE-family HTH domain
MSDKNRAFLAGLKRKMYILGLNQKMIAERTGVSEAAISYILNRKLMPSIELSKSIADVLEMDERELRSMLTEEAS